MYCDSIDSIDSMIQPDPLLIRASILYKILWKSCSNLNLLFMIVFADELKYTGVNSISLSGLCFFNRTFIVIWYLKPFVSFNRPLNKSLILDLLASNCAIKSFFSTISALHDLAYPLNAWSVFIMFSWL